MRFLIGSLCAIMLLAACYRLAEGAETTGVPAPQSIVIVACKVVDLTGKPGRHGVDSAGNYDEESAARDWRDLELYVNPRTLEFECRRDQLDLEDGSIWGAMAPESMIPLVPNFGDWAQCTRVGMMQASEYNEKHPGWGVVAVGCPSPIAMDSDNDGVPDTDEFGRFIVKDWKLPSCPTFLPGTQSRMRCNFSDSVI
jgi:hypothetical protein